MVSKAHFLLTRTFDVVSAAGEPVGTIEGGSTDLELRDPAGQTLALFHRPWVIFLTEVLIALPPREPVGAARQATPFGRIRFDLLDAARQPEGSLEPDGFGAHTFAIVERGRRTGVLRRQIRFLFKTGDYEISLEAASQRSMLFALGGVLAIDKAVHRRRGDGGGAPVGAS